MQLDSIRRTMRKCEFELLGLLTWEDHIGQVNFKSTDGERTVKITLRQDSGGKCHIAAVAAGENIFRENREEGLKIRLSDLEEFVNLYGK